MQPTTGSSAASSSMSGRPAHLEKVRKSLRLPGDTAASPQTKVYFHVEYSKVAFGETVSVVGSHPNLGAWHPDKGVRLTTNEAIFPIWISADPTFVELHSEVQYKFVVCHADGKHKEWEECTENRSFIASGEEMTIEDDDGQYRTLMGMDDDSENGEQDGDYWVKTKSPMVRKMDKAQKMAYVKDIEGAVDIGATDTIFMLAFQLPVNIYKDSNGVWQLDLKAPSDGRNFAYLPVLEEIQKTRKLKVVNVGWPGCHPENIRDRQAIEKLLAQHDFIPVFPPRKEFEQFVEFCTSFLWPVFHDSMQFFHPSASELGNEQGWASYVHINTLFANAVVTHTHETDLIWIQDYHLMMTPTFIARKLHKANVGFYLHTPFPSSDSFKSLPMREELLGGMLSADQLGFQFFSYARNFLVSCKRINGLDPIFRAGGFTGLDVNGRHVMIKVAHFAYPYQASREVASSELVTTQTAQVKSLFPDKVIFACMDRCDALSGLILKFQAFKQFLKAYPQYKGKVVLIQYCFAKLGGQVQDEAFRQSLNAEADAFLSMVDGELKVVAKEGGGDTASCDIFLRMEQVERSERLGLFRAADVLVDTSVKNGLNLMPFEFVAAHYDQDTSATLIVSEFSGCSRVLLGSLRINPWNNTELAATFDRALSMAEDEKSERFESNRQYVAQNSPVAWFEDFLADLRRARKKDDVRIESIGFGARMRWVCVGGDFQKLPINAVMSAYRNSKNRVFLLDNEGTLAADKRNVYRSYNAPKGDLCDLQSQGSPPNGEVLDCLRSLCSDSRNTVVILSGRNREMLEEWFGGVQRIGLAAERGFYYKLPFTTGDQWHCMQQKPDFTWKKFAYEIMRQFQRRTQGSAIEHKGSALVWQYRDADPLFGAMQAKELSSYLKELLLTFDVEIAEGKGYVEVKLRGIDKGVMVTKALSKVRQAFGEADFVMCIGDDRSDEDMFEAVNALFDPSEEVLEEDTGSQRSTTDDGSDSHSDPVAFPATRSTSEMLPRRIPSSGGLAGAGGLRGGLASMSSADFRGSLGGGLASLGEEDVTSTGPGRRFFTCVVGRKPSAAKFFLDDTDEVSEVLASLKLVQDKRSKEMQSNSYTWSGGDVAGMKPTRVGSMPGLSSLAFGRAKSDDD